MSTDGAREELQRAVQELRDLLEQHSATRYIQIGHIEAGAITSDPIVRSTRRPDYVYLSEINERSARDTELQALRYAAYRRAEEADMQIMRQEDAEWSQQEARIRRGKQIPEREVRFSWLHGPEEE